MSRSPYGLDDPVARPALAEGALAVLEDWGLPRGEVAGSLGWPGRDHVPRTYRDLGALLRLARARFPERPIGLALGERVPVWGLGVFGYALMSAPDLNEALEVALRYHAVVYPAIDFAVGRADGVVSITAKANVPLLDLRVVAHDGLVSSLAALAEQLTGTRLRLRSLELAYPAPPWADEYAPRLGVAPSFDHPKTRLRIDAAQLAARVRMADATTARLCLLECEARLKAEAPEPLIQSLRQRILERPGSLPTLQEAARALALSERSLSRRLREQGTTFRRVVDDVRRDLALEYLAESELTVEQIAHLVGYHDAPTFRRAFKRWTGQLPRGGKP